MRASRAERPRESVFKRPTNLDEICARVEAGEPSGYEKFDDEDDGGGRWRTRAGSSEGGQLEDLQREMQVLQMQHAHTSRQLQGAVAELDLHKRHAEEYKELLELAEADLCAAHEHTADLSQRLQLAQEGNRRNADMAQQLLIQLDATRVELKAQARREDSRLSSFRQSGNTSHPTQPGASSTASSAVAPTGADSSGACAPSHEWLSSRALLTPVTHDAGVQVDLPRSSGGGSEQTHQSAWDASTSRVALIALQHARELENVHRELQSRLTPAELEGLALREARPE